MTGATAATTARPVWVDLSTTDVDASREFYRRLFGWRVDVNPDPQYGGYAMATLDGSDVAGIGPQQTPGAPAAWSVYIGTDDAAGLGTRVTEAGGTVVMPAMDVGDQGRMAVFQDPAGAFFGAWQASAMRGFGQGGANTFGWAELSARGIDRAAEFYERVFGWSRRVSAMGSGAGDYTEFLLDGESIAGGMEMPPMVPAEAPSYWLVYFLVQDVGAALRTATDAGAQQLVAPTEFAGGQFAVVADPQGASFGLLRMAQE